MLKDEPGERPTCEEILKIKDLWALKEEDFEFDKKVKKIIDSKFKENELTVYSMLKSKIDLIENSS
jgi:hypothetical protein